MFGSAGGVWQTHAHDDIDDDDDDDCELGSPVLSLKTLKPQGP